ncbi:MAG: V4R domain-containing protein [Inquilinus sp.]|uniref:V4R domain-containing protein n=1 Tax=Inquilinus sp. TaxID=1932117 RepID=UPI003F329B6E
MEYGPGAGRPVCYMFEGFMTGALRHLLGDAGSAAAVECAETQCAAQGHDRCRFEFGIGLACSGLTGRADRRGRRARS